MVRRRKKGGNGSNLVRFPAIRMVGKSPAMEGISTSKDAGPNCHVDDFEAEGKELDAARIRKAFGVQQ